VLDEMQVDFENIMENIMEKKLRIKLRMNQESSDEEMLSDDSGYASDMSEYEIDRVEKFMQFGNPYVEHSY